MWQQQARQGRPVTWHCQRGNLAQGRSCLWVLTGSDLLWLVGLTYMSKACTIKSSVGHPAVLRTSMVQVAVCHLKTKTAAKLLS